MTLQFTHSSIFSYGRIQHTSPKSFARALREQVFRSDSRRVQDSASSFLLKTSTTSSSHTTRYLVFLFVFFFYSCFIPFYSIFSA